jgi:hypothetical protein
MGLDMIQEIISGTAWISFGPDKGSAAEGCSYSPHAPVAGWPFTSFFFVLINLEEMFL